MNRILIIEDQSDIRRLIRWTLEFEDYEIHEAANGPDGLAAAKALHPDLILLDVMMPGGLDGFQVCTQIKADPELKHTPVVILRCGWMLHRRQHYLLAFLFFHSYVPHKIS